MAVQTFQGIQIFYNADEMSCSAKRFDGPMVEVAKLDTTALCSSWESSIGGESSWSMQADLMQDFAANNIDQLLGISSSTFALPAPLTVFPAGIVDGSLAYFGSASELQFAPMSAAHGELAMAKLSASGQGPAVRGVVGHALNARTTSGTGAGQQLGLVTATQRLYAALHVTAVSGTTPSLAMSVQSDDNVGFTTPVNRITFTPSTAPNAQFASAVGPFAPDDRFRITYTISGTTPSFTFAVALGIGPAA